MFRLEEILFVASIVINILIISGWMYENYKIKKNNK